MFDLRFECVVSFPFESGQIGDTHIEIRVHAPYSPSHGSKATVHERTSTMYL